MVLDGSKPFAELSVRAAERFFRVDVQVMGKIGEGKKRVAKFVGDPILVRSAAGENTRGKL